MKKPALRSLITTVLVIVVVLALNTISPSLPLVSRAIVVGIAIDKEGDVMHLSAQIIQSGSSGESSKPGNSTYAILKGEGESLSTAIYDVSSTSGYYVSLAHCSAVILGEGMRGEDCFMPLNYLVKNTKLADDAVIVFSEGKASELMEKEVGLSFLSAFGLKKLEGANSDYSRAVACTARDFMVGDKTVTGTKAVPLCRVGEKIVEPEGAEQSTGKKVEFKLDEAVILGKGGELVLNEEQTLAYNLVKKNFNLGNVTLRDGNDVTDLVYSNKSVDVQVDNSGDKRVVKVNVDVTFLPFSEGRPVGKESEVSKNAIDKLENKYESLINEVFLSACQKGLDVYSVADKLDEAEKSSDKVMEVLKSLEITTEVNVKLT